MAEELEGEGRPWQPEEPAPELAPAETRAPFLAAESRAPFEEAAQCHVCRKPFTLFYRRHHCRNCSRSVCHAHSAGKLLVPDVQLVERRACDRCCADPDWVLVAQVPRQGFGLPPQASDGQCERSESEAWRVAEHECEAAPYAAVRF